MRLLWVLLFAGCASLPQGMHPVSTGGLIRAWTSAGYPAGSCPRRSGRVRAVVVADTSDLCYRSNVYGCYLGHECGGIFAWGQCYDIVVLRADRPVPPLMRHELTHWLLDCSGIVPGGDADHAHALWSTDGFGPLPTDFYAPADGAAGAP